MTGFVIPAEEVERVIDVQIHVWYTDRPDRPWIPDAWAGRSEISQAVFRTQLALSCPIDAALDELGVAGVRRTVLAPLGVYGFNNDLELESMRRHPDRVFGLAAVNHLDPKVAEVLQARLAEGFRGVRFAPMDWAGLARGDYDTFFRAAAAVACPVFLNLAHPLPDAFLHTIRAYRDVTFVIDHLGTGYAPPVNPSGPDPFLHLPDALAFSAEPNVWIKLTSAPALSRESFPFRDIWEPVRRVVSAFGAERVMWGSDFTRTNCLYSYREGLGYLWLLDGLSAEDRRAITSESTRRLLKIEPW